METLNYKYNKNNITKFLKNCSFCKEYGDIDNIELNKNSKVISAKDDYLLIASIGSLVEGYSIYIPKEHYNSFANLPQKELTKVRININRLRSVMSKVYNSKVIVAEHGTGNDVNVSSSSIYHAHLHLIPIENTKDFYPIFHKTGGRPIKIGNISELSEFEGESYIYLSLDEETHLIWTNTEKFIKQYIRWACAKVVGIESKYDWKIYPFEDNIKKTVKKLKPIFVNSTRIRP